MCTTCGCASGEVKIDGESVDHAHDHGHEDAMSMYTPMAPGTVSITTTPRPGPITATITPAAMIMTTHLTTITAKKQPTRTHRASARRAWCRSSRTSCPRTMPMPQSNRQRLAAAWHLCAEPGVQPRLGQDHAAVQDHRRLLRGADAVAVIEGDQQTSHDAERIRATGAPAVQINTGKGCHLDAHMVGQAMQSCTRRQLPADDRERRQPGLPGRFRPGRGAQGGDPVGDRGRRQAAQVPGHVPRRRA